MKNNIDKEWANYFETRSVEIGGNPLPQDVQEKLGEFLDWLDVHYEVDIGTTALYWGLSAEISNRIVRKND